MEGLTKEEAIKRHRMLWNYIADESERKGVPVSKYTAVHKLWSSLPNFTPMNDCWACEASDTCNSCIIKWPGGDCGGPGNIKGLYVKWLRAYNRNDLKDYVSIAREIANLPEA